MKTTILCTCIGLLLLACHPAKHFTREYIHGKRYYQALEPPPRPEMGGLDFFEFHDDSKASIKRGDMMIMCTYKITDETVTLQDDYTNENYTFHIKNKDTVEDSKGVRWVYKQNL